MRERVRVDVVLAVSGMAAAIAAGQADPLAEPFPAVLDLSDLDGAIGLAIHGAAGFDTSGSSVASAGDLNGDGVDDVVIGAYRADAGGIYAAGACYVVFGRAGTPSEPWPAALSLADLDGATGFRFDGALRGGLCGQSVAPAGDVNGDGVADLIVGAPGQYEYGYGTTPGAAYVIFGRDTGAGGAFPAVLSALDLDGQTGFRIDAADQYDNAGRAVASTGDLNGDGIDDLAVGAPVLRGGACYVIYGRAAATAPFPAAISLADVDGSIGFRIVAAAGRDQCGRSVACAGDVNADGWDDLIIGAPAGVPSDSPGAAFVVFGRDAATSGPFPASLALTALDGIVGFRLDGEGARDRCGVSVASAGDLDGDGVGDLVIGASGADTGGVLQAGATYVVFGRDAAGGPWPAAIALAGLDGQTGFKLAGIAQNDYSGGSVASLGDVNGDGLGDLAIGIEFADPSGRASAGSTAVVFGRDASATGAFPAVFSLSDLDGLSGFKLDGVEQQDNSGGSVAPAGDVNGDGMADFIVGADQATAGGLTRAGESYVVFGRRPAATCPADLDGDGELTIFDFLAFQNAFDAMDPVADFDGDGELTLFDFLAFQNAFDAGCE